MLTALHIVIVPLVRREIAYGVRLNLVNRNTKHYSMDIYMHDC